MLHRWKSMLAAAAAVAGLTVPLEANNPEVPAAIRSGSEAVVTVHVRNDYRRDVTVHLVTSDGRRLELGPVDAQTTHVFRVNESVLNTGQSVRLRVVSSRESRSDLSTPLVSDDTVLSRSFAIDPGALVHLEVGPDLASSRAWIRRG